ncbi:MAG: GxxExxY protein, partial [Chitinophagales bacterium]
MIHEKLIYDITGCLFDVYNQLGNIWAESIYEQALQIALQEKGIHVVAQQNYEVLYKKGKVGLYRPDLLVEDKVIIELKAVETLNSIHQAQLISYLKGFEKPIGILANFTGRKLQRKIIPNKYHQMTVLKDVLDFDKVNIPSKNQLKYIFDTAV